MQNAWDMQQERCEVLEESAANNQRGILSAITNFYSL
jgi:hypothetical protein